MMSLVIYSVMRCRRNRLVTGDKGNGILMASSRRDLPRVGWVLSRVCGRRTGRYEFV